MSKFSDITFPKNNKTVSIFSQRFAQPDGCYGSSASHGEAGFYAFPLGGESIKPPAYSTYKSGLGRSPSPDFKKVGPEPATQRVASTPHQSHLILGRHIRAAALKGKKQSWVEAGSLPPGIFSVSLKIGSTAQSIDAFGQRFAQPSSSPSHQYGIGAPRLSRYAPRVAAVPNGEKAAELRSAPFTKTAREKGYGKKGSALKSIRVGDICNLKITALAPNNIGIDELTYPSISIFVPNAQIGTSLTAKILKIQSVLQRTSINKLEAKGLKNYFYAIAQPIENSKTSETKKDQSNSKNQNSPPVKPGDVLTVSILKEFVKNPTIAFSSLKKTPNNLTTDGKGSRIGIVDLNDTYRLIIPFWDGISSKNVKVTITRVKSNYAFALISLLDKNNERPPRAVASHRPVSQIGEGNGETVQSEINMEQNFNLVKNALLQNSDLNNTNELSIPTNFTPTDNTLHKHWVDNSSGLITNLKTGCKFTTILPLNATKYGKYLVFKINETVLFLKTNKDFLSLWNQGSLTDWRALAGSQMGDSFPSSVRTVEKQPSLLRSEGVTGANVEKGGQKKGKNSKNGFIPIEKEVELENSLKYFEPSTFSDPDGTHDMCDALKNSAKQLPLTEEGKRISILDTYKNKKREGDLKQENISKLKVRIKIISSTKNCAVGKILQLNPITHRLKKAIVLNNIREMMNHGMHFGEKAVKCHARMKNYIWLKKGKSRKLPYAKDLFDVPSAFKGERMPDAFGTVNAWRSQALSEKAAGVPQQNPPLGKNVTGGTTGKGYNTTAKRAKPLIKKGRHIINLLKTRRCLNKALNTLTKYALKGRTFLFIGTKKPATGLVALASFFTKNSFYVNTRWLGGMLTNWKTICKSIAKIRPILKEKQKVGLNILERRQSIKLKLIQKALLLKQKSKLILSKARFLLNLLRNSNVSSTPLKKHSFYPTSTSQKESSLPIVSIPTNKNGFSKTNPKGIEISQKTSKERESTEQMHILLQRTDKLNALRKSLISKGMNYLQKRQNLNQKNRKNMYETLLLKEKGLLISTKYKEILNQLTLYTKKIREYKTLLILTTAIQKLKTITTKGSLDGLNVNDQNANKILYSISYGKLKNFQNSVIYKRIVPNPPKDILNRMVLTMKNGEQITGLSKNGAANLLQTVPEASDTFKSKRKSMIQSTDNPNIEIASGFAARGKKSTVPDSSSGSSPLSAGLKGFGLETTAENTKVNTQIFICSTLLSKFSTFSTTLKNIIKTLIISVENLLKRAHYYEEILKKIKLTLVAYLDFKKSYVKEMKQLKTKLKIEKTLIKIVKRKLKVIDAQKKLLQFLPRLRYLPTPQTQISQIVQILLTKIVDPKLKYPTDVIYDQKLSRIGKKKKKVAAARKKKWQRLEKYFGGIANMTKYTKNQITKNVAIIIGQKEEINAVRECQKLGIKMFTIVDTNCNPTLSDHIIPANDDSRNSIKYILTKFITRIRLAQKLRARLQKRLAVKK
uniref:Small ribosomal subunit protein uS2c n=1 Tax=Haematococcus lacustris TaxID=44745 RepID=A0A0S2IDP1_HAELA|nr:ribosomal protein S2 [Haematococcus lacustris]